MTDQIEQSEFKHRKEAPAHPGADEFDEAPGEAEAEAARDAFLKHAGTQPAEVAQALSGADGATRSSAVSRLQRQRGNRYIQRVVAESQHGRPGRLVGLPQSEMVNEVQRRKSGGNELAGDARDKLEGHFGADLSGVRVHADSEAADLSRELNAQAFTVGSDVFFAEGKYNPGSSEGQGLLAHELTHVGQQTGFAGPGVQREADEEAAKKAAEAAPEQKPQDEETSA